MSVFLDDISSSFNDFIDEVGSLFEIDRGKSSISGDDDYTPDTTTIAFQNALLIQANQSSERMLAYIHQRKTHDDSTVVEEAVDGADDESQAAVIAADDPEIQALVQEVAAKMSDSGVELSELFLVLMQLLEKLGGVASDSKRQQSEYYMERKAAINNEMLEQMKEYREKVREAEKKAKTMEVLTYVGAAIAITVGAALMATGVGFFVGALVIGLAVDAIYTQASDNNGLIATASNELAEALEENTSLNETEAQIVAAVIVALALIILTMGAGALGNAVFGGGSAAAAGGASATASTASAAAASTKRAADLAMLAVKFGTVVESGLTISQAIMNIDLAIARYEAQMESVDVEEKKLQQELIQAYIEQVIAMLEDIIENKSDKITKQSEEIDRNGQAMTMVANNIGN